MPRYKDKLDTLLVTVLNFLLSDLTLPETYRDHELSGNWDHYRECHLKPDLLLIYQKQNIEILRLVRLGSHSELFKK